MKLTRLYGQKAINVQDGRLQYFSKSGVIDVPEHLVRRVMEQGFSLKPFADVAVPSDPSIDADPEDPSISTAPPVASTPEPLATPPATLDHPLPPAHPQVETAAAIATKEQLRAAEDRLRKTSSS